MSRTTTPRHHARRAQQAPCAAIPRSIALGSGSRPFSKPWICHAIPKCEILNEAWADLPRAAALCGPACEIRPQILAGVAGLAGRDVFGGAGGDDVAAGVAAFG